MKFIKDLRGIMLLLLSYFSRVQLCVTPETAAHQAPLCLGFSRQEHWSGLPFPSPMHESEKWKWDISKCAESYLFLKNQAWMTRNIFFGNGLYVFSIWLFVHSFICQFIHQIIVENMLSAGPFRLWMVKTRLRVLKEAGGPCQHHWWAFSNFI